MCVCVCVCVCYLLIFLLYTLVSLFLKESIKIYFKFLSLFEVFKTHLFLFFPPKNYLLKSCDHKYFISLTLNFHGPEIILLLLGLAGEAGERVSCSIIMNIVNKIHLNQHFKAGKKTVNISGSNNYSQWFEFGC